MRATETALETVEANIAWMDLHLEEVTCWLKEEAGEECDVQGSTESTTEDDECDGEDCSNSSTESTTEGEGDGQTTTDAGDHVRISSFLVSATLILAIMLA